MKKFILVLMLMCSVSVYAQQTQKEKIEAVRVLFQQYFNEKNAEKIYSLAGEDFKKEIAEDAFTGICENQLFPLGSLNEVVLENFTNGVNRYKAVFEGAVLNMFLSLDSSGKLQTFLFKPYKEPVVNKKVSVLSGNALQTPLDKNVDSIIQSYIRDASTSGVSIGILKDGKTYIYHYGETKKGNKQLPDNNSIYEIGSVSKTFTAILLADAFKKNKIKLTDEVNKYLPDSIPALQQENKPVTIQMLINHSSAIPRMPDNFMQPDIDEDNPYKMYDKQDLFSYLKNLQLKRAPGKTYEYSNTAVGLLGVILENIYKKSYNELISDVICKPLGLTDTKQLLAAADQQRFVQGYTATGEASGAWDFQSLAAAGAIRSTITDMLLYLQANLDTKNKTLNEAIQLTHIPTFENGGNTVAMAWHILKPDNQKIIFHNGETGGFHSYMAFNQAKKYGVVILSNCAMGMEEQGNKLIHYLDNN